jgi:CBS domain-containing protein
MYDIPVRRFMSTTLVTVRPDATFDSAAKLMETRRVHHALVIDGAALVGILSSADLLKVALLRRTGPTDAPAGQDDALDMRVRDVMENGVVTISENRGLREVAVALSLGGYHALPVVALDGTPVGIVTSSDLATMLLEHIEERVDHSAIAQTGGPQNSHADLVEVLSAADAYLHSGQSAQQHARLLRAVQRAREHDGSTPLALSA